MSENSAPRKLSRGKIALIAAVVAIVIIAVAVYLLTADSRAYSRGVELQEAGAYSEAIAVLETIPDYKDARERINACSYAIALAQEKAGSYAEAQAAFAALGEYEDAAAHAHAIERGNGKDDQQAEQQAQRRQDQPQPDAFPA